MRCVISGGNVKVFGKAIHSLSKIGDELYIESLLNGLSIRTVNAARSAYACFLFLTAFFGTYVHTRVPDSDDDTRCKISLKSCLAIFKSMYSLEKSVETCTMTVDMDSYKVIFQLYCKYGIVKTYQIAFVESESLQVVFSAQDYPNTIGVHSRLLTDIVSTFSSNQEEVTLSVSDENTKFRTYIEDDSDSTTAVRSELCLTKDEFDNYNVPKECEITFCLREVKALLVFTEIQQMPIKICFKRGRPIIFSFGNSVSFEGTFVLATLMDHVDDPTSATQPRTQQHRSHQKTGKNSTAKKSTINGQERVGDDGEQPCTSGWQSSHRSQPSLNKDTNNVFEVEDSPMNTIPNSDESSSSAPPNKKFRASFLGLSRPSVAPHDIVLASDTDDDS